MMVQYRYCFFLETPQWLYYTTAVVSLCEHSTLFTLQSPVINLLTVLSQLNIIYDKSGENCQYNGETRFYWPVRVCIGSSAILISCVIQL